MRRYITIDRHSAREREHIDGHGRCKRQSAAARERLAERYEYERAVMPPAEPVKRWPEKG